MKFNSSQFAEAVIVEVIDFSSGYNQHVSAAKRIESQILPLHSISLANKNIPHTPLLQAFAAILHIYS